MRAPVRAAVHAPCLDLTEFFKHHGRLPRIGDAIAPWRYRGWLLVYVIQLHQLVPAAADRWGYHLRTLDAGRLLDEPIPQIVFGAPDTNVFTLLHDWCACIGRDCGSWSDFRSLLDWLSWALAVSKEEPQLSDAVNEKLYRRVNLAQILTTPFDYLGESVAQSRAKGWNPTGFYPTPHPVVECMVRMTMHDDAVEGRDPRTAKVCDPAVGSGRMLLHASNYTFCLFGQDIDPLAIAMCKINGALYAPWMSFPLPASIVGADVDANASTVAAPEPPPACLRPIVIGRIRRRLLFES